MDQNKSNLCMKDKETSGIYYETREYPLSDMNLHWPYARTFSFPLVLFVRFCGERFQTDASAWFAWNEANIYL